MKPFRARASTESAALFGLFGELNGVPEVGFRPPLHFVADGPMILPKRVFGMVSTCIHQGKSPLEIVDQGLAGQFRKLAQEGLIEAVGVIGITAGVEEDKRFSDVNVFGLLGVELPDDHNAAKYQQEQEQEDKAILAQKIH